MEDGAFVAITHCWCGNNRLEEFSDAYFRCRSCETIILKNWPSSASFKVQDDATDFYGRQYYESYVQRLGYPNLQQRARADLPERCLHWLNTILKFKLPPGQVLELGSAHGGFVALLNWSGFDATGLEMSTSAVKLAEKTFGIKTLLGPIEEQNIEVGSLDVIALMDVLEHFPDPSKTMRHCLSLLKPDGILLIQTPRYPAGKSFDELSKSGDQFLIQLKPSEHLFLFSEESVTEFFRRLTANHIRFESAIFAHYDMFFVVCRIPIISQSTEAIEKSLLSHFTGRLVQSLIDQDAKLKSTVKRLESSEADLNHWRTLYYQLREKKS